MKKLRFLRQWWRPVLWLGVPLVLTGLILTWRLAHSPAGITTGELERCSGTIPAVYAPYYWLLHSLPADCSLHHIFWLRFPSVLFAILAGILFVATARTWFGRRTAWYGGALFLLSSWFLHAGRLAAPEVMLLAVVPAWLALLRCGRHDPDSRLTGLYAALTVSYSLFVPGGVWFVLLAAAWCFKPILAYIRQQSLTILAPVVAIPVASAIYLGISLAQHTGQIGVWLGWPGGESWTAIARHIGAVPLHLFLHGPDAPALWLGHRPVLDIFTAVMALIGLIRLLRYGSRQKLVPLLAVLVLGFALCGLRPSGIGTLDLLVPAMYLLAAGGVYAMLRRWFEVFPRNPFAKWLAYSLLAVVVSGAILLNLRDYFVAWPNAAVTRQEFSIKP